MSISAKNEILKQDIIAQYYNPDFIISSFIAKDNTGKKSFEISTATNNDSYVHRRLYGILDFDRCTPGATDQLSDIISANAPVTNGGVGYASSGNYKIKTKINWDLTIDDILKNIKIKSEIFNNSNKKCTASDMYNYIINCMIETCKIFIQQYTYCKSQANPYYYKRKSTAAKFKPNLDKYSSEYFYGLSNIAIKPKNEEYLTYNDLSLKKDPNTGEDPYIGDLSNPDSDLLNDYIRTRKKISEITTDNSGTDINQFFSKMLTAENTDMPIQKGKLINAKKIKEFMLQLYIYCCTNIRNVVHDTAICYSSCHGSCHNSSRSRR